MHKEMAAAHPGACGRARSRCLTTRPPLAQPIWELWAACPWGQSTKPQAEGVPRGNFQKQPEPQRLLPAFLSALKWRWPQRAGKRSPVPSLWHSHTVGPQEGAMARALCVCLWAGRFCSQTSPAGSGPGPPLLLADRGSAVLCHGPRVSGVLLAADALLSLKPGGCW